MSEQDEQKDQGTDKDREELTLSVGYSIGVRTDGGLFFQLHGEKQGAVELLGLNKLAEKQINTIVDSNLEQGEPQIIQGLNSIYKELQGLKETLTPAPQDG